MFVVITCLGLALYFSRGTVIFGGEACMGDDIEWSFSVFVGFCSIMVVDVGDVCLLKCLHALAYLWAVGVKRWAGLLCYCCFFWLQLVEDLVHPCFDFLNLWSIEDLVHIYLSCYQTYMFRSSSKYSHTQSWCIDDPFCICYPLQHTKYRGYVPYMFIMLPYCMIPPSIWIFLRLMIFRGIWYIYV